MYIYIRDQRQWSMFVIKNKNNEAAFHFLRYVLDELFNYKCTRWKNI